MKWMRLISVIIIVLIIVAGCKSIEEDKEEIRNAAPEIDESRYVELVAEVIDLPDDELDKTVVQERLVELEVEYRSQEAMWDQMHQMANTKIVADKIWGEITITESLVDELIIEVSASDYSDKMKLLEILYNWKNKDFSYTVDEHNYIWSNLDGTVGKATGLRE